MSFVRFYVLLLLVVCLFDPGDACARLYDMRDPQGLNTMTISIESRLQPVVGIANGIWGTVTFDPEKPQATTADIRLEVSSILFSNPEMTEAVHSETWLDAQSHPEIRMTVKGVVDIEELGEGTWSLRALGALSILGRPSGFEAPVRISLIENGMTERTGGKTKGDLVIVRTTLSVDRQEIGLNPDPALSSILGSHVDVTAALVGYAQ